MKKKSLFKSVIPLILCFMMLFSTSSFIYAVETVDVNESFTIENGVLESYWGEDKDVVIPDGVTKIASSAFKNDDWIESIVIPDTVTEIDNWAFYWCKNLREINLPDSITEIGEYAFKDCSSLEEIIVPGSVKEIKNSLFDDCVSLKHVKLSEGVKTIGNAAFHGCENLETIEFPESIEAVCTGALQGTAWLEKNQMLIIHNVLVDVDENMEGEFEIPEGVTTIGEYAFSGCSSLLDVYISNTVTTIEEGAFSECQCLRNVYVPSSVTYIAPGAFLNDPKTGSYSEDVVLCAETGSYAQKYRYYDHWDSHTEGTMSYMPTNESENRSPYVIQYYEDYIFSDEFDVDGWMLEELSEINEIYPIELINNVGAKYTFPIGLLKDRSDYNSLWLYGTLITNPEEIDVSWEWENQNFTKEDFVAQYKVEGYWGYEGMTVSVPLGKAWSGEKIYCYRGIIDTSDGSLCYEGLNGIVDEDGYLTLTQDDVLGKYIFTTKEPEENKPSNPSTPGTPAEPDSPNTPQEPSNPNTPEIEEAPVIESYTDTQVVLDVTEKPVIKKDYFEAIVQLNNEHDYEVVFHAGDNVYITFEKETMSMVEGVEDYDFTVTIQPDYDSSKIPAIVGKDAFVSKVIYNYSGKLPAMATIRIPVGTEYVGKTLYYTLLNGDGTFGTEQKVVVDENGCIKVQQDHCSSYIITTVDLNTSVDIPNTGDRSLITLWVMLFIMGGCIYFIGVKKKNVI